jgi:hypothetical protein
LEDAFGDALEDDVVVNAVEGRGSRHHHVEDNAEGPDVALLIVVAFDDLGGDVIRLQVHVKG